MGRWTGGSLCLLHHTQTHTHSVTNTHARKHARTQNMDACPSRAAQAGLEEHRSTRDGHTRSARWRSPRESTCTGILRVFSLRRAWLSLVSRRLIFQRWVAFAHRRCYMFWLKCNGGCFFHRPLSTTTAVASASPTSAAGTQVRAGGTRVKLCANVRVGDSKRDCAAAELPFPDDAHSTDSGTLACDRVTDLCACVSVPARARAGICVCA